MQSRRARAAALTIGLSSISMQYQAAAQEGDAAFTLDTIIVTSEKKADEPTQVAPDAAALLSTAGDLGDPLKAILALPSITFGGGDFEDPVIRGGGPTDNLFYVDGIPMSNILHQYTDSVISDRVVRTFDLHSSAPPVQFRPGSGGVVDIGLRAPRRDRWHTGLDIGQFKSGVLLEGPLSENVGAYVSFRENLSRVLLTQFDSKPEAGEVTEKLPESRDYTARLQWSGENTTWTATALGSFDRTESQFGEGADLADATLDQREFNAAALQMKKGFGGDGELTATAAYSANRYRVFEPGLPKDDLNVDTTTFRTIYSQPVGAMAFDLGMNIRHDAVDKHTVSDASFSTSRDFIQLDGFASIRLPATEALSFDVGAVVAHDDYLGDTKLDPRIGADWQLGDRQNLFLRAGVTHQRPAVGDLVDLPDNIARRVEQDQAAQVTVGYRTFLGDDWRAQTEVYYKDVKVTDTTLTDLMIPGAPLPARFDGQIYGADFIVSRAAQQGLYGFFALSLSENTRQNPSTDTSFDYPFSAPISATVAANYAFDKWNVGAKYRYQTGQAFTPGLGVIPGADPLRDPVNGRHPDIIYGEPFSKRSENYHRLDVRVERTIGWGFADASAYVDFLNVLGASNPYDATPAGFQIDPNGLANFSDDDNKSEGVPSFIALGIKLDF